MTQHNQPEPNATPDTLGIIDDGFDRLLAALDETGIHSDTTNAALLSQMIHRAIAKSGRQKTAAWLHRAAMILSKNSDHCGTVAVD